MAMSLCIRGGSLIIKSFPSSTYFVSSSSYLSRSVRPAIALTEFPKWFPSTTISGAAAKSKCMSTEADTTTTSSSMNDHPQSNLNSRTPPRLILLDGMDYEHWVIVMEKPQGEPTRDEIIATYINTLAKLLGSEEEARMKIYSVSTRYQFAFGALISEDQRYKIRELPGVRRVFPDAYMDAANKDYGGEPFINGKAVPYDPKYDMKWGTWNFDESDMEEEKEDTQNPESE
ncbi:hypothetical protein MKW92_052325 [Papaver armeniacum]|nr:hypothetical protein MKW92_052325 [Papaver armeniacum]